MTIQLLKPFIFDHRAVLLPGFADVDATWWWVHLSATSLMSSLFHAHAATLRTPLGEWLPRSSRGRSGSGDGEAAGPVVAVVSDFFLRVDAAARGGCGRAAARVRTVRRARHRRQALAVPPHAEPPRRGRGARVRRLAPGPPGAPAFPWRQLSRMYRSYAEGGGDEHAEAIKDNFLWNLDSVGFVCNTCHGLDA